MKKPNVLCICAKGMNRSRYLSEYLKELKYKTKYGGVEGYKKELGKAPNQITQKEINWSDLIIITRKRLESIFKKLFNIKDKRILVFDIPDLTEYGESNKTKEILKKTIKPYLPLKK
ncbi:MAG: hypothetical protein ACOC3Z_00425 [Nanoarchaeota archaeon]